MYSYVIAIPSYQRAELLMECTLATLKIMKQPTSLIYIFVANASEYKRYTNILPRMYHANIVKGVLGLGKQRNFISKYFDVGTHIVHMDDDVTKLLRHDNKVIENLTPWVNMAFSLCTQHNCKLWGVYPIDSRLCMSQTATIGWAPLIGTVFGVINDRSADLQQTYNNCEDLERSLKHICKFGAVVRLNGVCFRTRGAFYTGGLGKGPERLADYNVQMTKLQSAYGAYIQRRVDKQGVVGDWLVFKRSKAQKRIPTRAY